MMTFNPDTGEWEETNSGGALDTAPIIAITPEPTPALPPAPVVEVAPEPTPALPPAFDPKELGLQAWYGNGWQGNGQDGEWKQPEQLGWWKPAGENQTQSYDMSGKDLGISQNSDMGAPGRMALMALAAVGAAGAGGFLGGSGGAGSAFGAGAGAADVAGLTALDSAAYAGAGDAFLTSGAGALTSAGADVGGSLVGNALTGAGDMFSTAMSKLGVSFTPEAIASGAAKNITLQFVANGGDISKINWGAALASGVIAPIGNAVGSAVTGGMAPGMLRDAATGALSGGTNAALSGQDIGKGALLGGVTGALSPVVKSGWEKAKGVFSGSAPVTTSISGANTGTGIGGWNSNAYLPEGDYVPTKDYGIGGVSESEPYVPTKDYGSGSDYTFGKGTTTQLNMPTYPGLTPMGGGQGLTVTTPQGRVGALGLVPTGSSPILGDPKSFINDPTVLGKTVFGPDTVSHPDGTSSSTQPENKKSGGGDSSTNIYSYSSSLAAALRRKYGTLPVPELVALGFSPELIRLIQATR